VSWQVMLWSKSRATTMQLILIRHGQTEENILDVLQGHLPGTLSEKGKEDNLRLASYLADYDLDHIYSSDLKRAADTADQIIKHHPNLQILFTPLLRERTYGSWEGKTRAELGVEKTHFSEWDMPGDAETVLQMQGRAAELVEMLRNKHEGKNVLLVTHGFFIRVLLSALLKKEFDLTENEPKNSSIFCIDLTRDPVVVEHIEI
jgi:broad specificity phosphatase PhoE